MRIIKELTVLILEALGPLCSLPVPLTILYVLLRAFIFPALFYLWVFLKVPGLLSSLVFSTSLPFLSFFEGFGLVGLLPNRYLQLLIFLKVNFT